MNDQEHVKKQNRQGFIEFCVYFLKKIGFGYEG